MATERQIQELIARCVSIVVFFHNSPKTSKMRTMMVAEVQAVARSAEELGMGDRAKDERILLSVESELLARYGQEVGRRLNAEFARAFRGSGMPVLSHARA